MASKHSPYEVNDTYEVIYPDGEYSLERKDTLLILQPSGHIHTVVEGETLQSISFKFYGDSGRWADISTINQIFDPLNLEVGQVLIIPK